MTALLVAHITGEVTEIKTRHYAGLSPQLTGGLDTRRLLPLAAVLVIESETDGIFLQRYAANSQFAGDTWHVSIDEAKEQANYEYGEAVSAWKPVPPNVEDLFGFAQS